MTDDIDGFPKDLLSKPWRTRLAYFKEYVMKHDILESTLQNVVQWIEEPAGAMILFVYGPPGVGKTTMIAQIAKEILTALAPLLEIDRGRIPLLHVDATQQGNRASFDWIDFYKRILKSANEPLIDYKQGDILDLGGKIRPNNPFSVQEQIIVGSSKAERDLRMYAEDLLLNRRVIALIIDEAQHIGNVATGASLQNHLDCLKSFATASKTLLVLVGSYDLLKLRNLNGQLARRGSGEHFRRYNHKLKDDKIAFISTVWGFQRHLPLPVAPDLINDWYYLYEGSLGCTGLLKSWLTSALFQALKNMSPTLTRDHLERTAFPEPTLIEMALEATTGENSLIPKEGNRARLRTLLNMIPALDEEDHPPINLENQGKATNSSSEGSASATPTAETSDAEKDKTSSSARRGRKPKPLISETTGAEQGEPASPTRSGRKPKEPTLGISDTDTSKARGKRNLKPGQRIPVRTPIGRGVPKTEDSGEDRSEKTCLSA